jgi:hypothetical protein
MAVGGQNIFDVLAANPIMSVAVRGKAMNDATQSTILGIRKMVEIDMPGVSRSDSQMEPYKDAQEIKIKYEAWQDNYDAIKRAYLLAMSLLQVVFQYDTDYYNFMDYNGKGEGLLGLEMMLEVTESDITLTLNFHGKIRPSIWQQILDAAASAAAGGSGGTTVSGLTQGVFNDAEYGIPGIEAVYVGTGDLSVDDDMGLLETGGTKFSWTLVKIGDTTLMQPISRRNEFKNTFGMYQNKVKDLKALHLFTNTEKVISWVLKNGVTFVFDKCTKLVEGPKINDQLGIVEVRNEGMVFADAVNGTPTRVTFDDANKKITFHRS